MASWMINNGGILGKKQLGLGNSTGGGFGSNSALTPPRQTVNAAGGFELNSVILPKDDGFTPSQSPFGPYPVRQSPPFCTNPTDVATPLSSPFGTNSAFRNETDQQMTIPIERSPFSTDPNPTPDPFSSGNSQSRGNQGTWVEPYEETPEECERNCNLSSISAMPVYFNKSHEELRLEDYQLNGKTANTGSIPEELKSECYQSTGNSGNDFGSSSLFDRQTAPNTPVLAYQPPFYSPFSTNPNPFPVGNSTPIFQQTSNVDPTFQQPIISFSTLHPSNFSSSAVSSQFVSHPTGGGQFSSVKSIPLFGQTISSPTTTSPFGTRPFSSQISSSGPFYTSSMISSSQSPLGTSPFGSQISSTSPFFTSSSSQSSLGTRLFGSQINSTGPFFSSSLWGTRPSFCYHSSTSPFCASSVTSSPQSPMMGTSPFASQISSTSSPFTSFVISSPQSSLETNPFGSQISSTSPYFTSSVISSSQSPVISFGTTATINSGFGTSNTASTGGCPTGTISPSSSAVINISISVSPSPISSSSSSSTETPGHCFVNPPASNSQCLGFSVPNTCTSYMPTPFFSVPHPVLVIPLPVSTGHLGNLSFTTQTTISSPASGTVPAFSNSPTESIITSSPEHVSTGSFIPRFGSSTENTQQPISQWSVSSDPSYVTNPIATEAAATLPKTVQYENSCLPVSDNAERSPLFNVRPSSLVRDTMFPFEMSKPNEDKKEDTSFIGELLCGVYKRRAAPILEENPPTPVVCPNEEQKLDENLSNLSVSDNSTNMCKKGGKKSWKDIKHGDVVAMTPKHSCPMEPSMDVIAMIPKLTRPEYYMEPTMDDLAANEMKMPGFCRQVKDFVIGRRDYGSIKFLGETDVRNLDLESIVKFNLHDVMVNMDDKAKLPVWQGDYKAAEITILNVKCIDKNTGELYRDGPKVDAYKQLLMRKTVEQGGEFVSFDPVKGEWIFKIEF